MKSLRFVLLPCWAAILVCLSSCGGSEEKTDPTTTTDTTTSTTTATTAEPTAPASAIVTTPQGMMIVRHKVADFDKWKPSYEEHDSMRLANGLHSYVIGRNVQDPSSVLVAVKVDDMNKAKAFGKDASLKKAMQKGGVTGTPRFNYVTMVWQDTARLAQSDIRSMTQFSVKDWAAWQKNFEEGRQQRIDNGLVDRAYGHDAEDDHKVVLVVAVEDSAKAYPYWKSDLLKERRKAGGVIGEPERYVFRVVERY